MRCKCRKGDKKCGPGCQCTGCANMDCSSQNSCDDDFHWQECRAEKESEMVETSDEESDDEENVDAIMETVFGLMDSEDDD